VTAHYLLIVIIAVLAFLALNLRSPRLPRARIFLGDSGSMMLGVLKGAAGVLEGVTAIQAELSLVPLYAGQPLFDEM